jgi:hypothetical protein
MSEELAAHRAEMHRSPGVGWGEAVSEVSRRWFAGDVQLQLGCGEKGIGTGVAEKLCSCFKDRHYRRLYPIPSLVRGACRELDTVSRL